VSTRRSNARGPAPADDTAAFEALLRRRRRAKRYVLTLYITGSTPRSTLAIGNIRALCEEFLPDRYDLEVIDIYQQPAQAATAQIIAAPTLVKRSPRPVRRLVGDLSSRERVLSALNLRSVSPDGKSGRSASLHP
jgi:circadian clock protein KaiB